MGLLSYTPKPEDAVQGLEPYEPTSTVKLVKDSFVQAVSTETTFASKYPRELRIARNKSVNNHIKLGDIPKEIVRKYKGDYNFMAVWANKNLGTQILTDADLIKKKSDIIKNKSEEIGQQWERATTFQKGLGMIGTIGGATVSLDSAASIITGGVASIYRGLSAFESIKRAAKVGVALEAYRQYKVAPTKTALDIEYSVKDILANLVYAGIGETVGVGIGIGLKQFTTSKILKSLDGIEKKYADHLTKEAVDEIEHLRTAVKSGVSDDVEEIVESLQRKTDEWENIERIKTGTPVDEARRIDEMVIEDRIAELQREVLATPKELKLFDEVADLQDQLKVIKKLKTPEADIDRTLIEDRFLEIEKQLNLPELKRARAEIAELEAFQDAAKAKAKAKPKAKPDEGGTAHPDKFEHVDNAANKEWLKTEGQDMVEEVLEESDTISTITDCLISNGVKI